MLITGGAGFIGSHLSDELLRAGDQVRVLDSLVDQVHEGASRPEYLDPEVELQIGDVRDRDAVDRALDGVDAVVHLAARVGVGQSMYEIAEYAAANTAGTGVLLEALLDRSVGKLVVASSMSVYGEGLYVREDGTPVVVHERSREQLAARDIRVVDGTVVGLEITNNQLSGVRLRDGTVVARQALVVTPRFVANSRLLACLGLNPTPHPFGEHIAADATGRTAVPGVWVAGNVADLSATVIAAAAGGVVAGGAINADLVAEDVARSRGRLAAGVRSGRGS